MMESRQIRNPFPGLRPFDTDEYRLFFGREGQSDELLARLQRAHFLAVVGTSGSGKSSLIRAGLQPALRGGLMAGAGSGWRIAVMRPGGDPIGNLALELAKKDALPEAGGGLPSAEAEAVIDATLRGGSLGLVDVARQGRLAEHEKLLVVVDQFEELFRFRAARDKTNAGDEAAAFVKLLLEASQQRELSIYVVLTMRSDFLGDCAQFQGLPEAINDGQYLIPRMTRDERRFAVTGPVGVTRGKITEPLVNRLLNDVGDNPDQLPILQHALMRTWDYWQTHRRNGEPIGIEHYEAIGAMSDALSRHADEAWDELPDARSRQIAELLFKALSERGADNREIRRPTRLQTICDIAAASPREVIAVIDVFRGGGRSFLMPPTGVALQPESVIDISHESLIRNWQRLKEWVNEEAQSARIYRRLAEAAVLHREGSEGLLQDPALQIALDWREKSQANAAWGRRYHAEFETAIAYLEASRAARAAEIAARELHRNQEIERERRELEQTRAFAAQQAQSARRLRWLAAGMALMFILALTTAAYAMAARKRAGDSEAEARRQEAIATELLAKERTSNQLLLSEQTAKQEALEHARKQTGIAKGLADKADKERARADQQARLANERALREQKAREEIARAQTVEKLMLKTNQDFRHATSARQMGNDELTEISFRQAFKGFSQLKNFDGMADTNVALGELLLLKNPIKASVDAVVKLPETSPEREQAVKYLDEAAAFYSQVPDVRAAAYTLVKAGESFYSVPYRGHRGPTEEESQADLQRQREGVKRFEEALKNFELLHDDPNIIETLKKISEFYGNFKDDADRRRALAAYEKLSRYPSVGPEPLMKTAQLYFAVNQPARADEYLSKKVKLHRDAVQLDEAVGTYVSAGEFLAGELKDKERAGSYFERALKLCHEICEKNDEANMLIRIGKQVDSLVGDQRAAVGYFDKALQIHRERGDREAEADALTEISQLFTDRCEPGLEDSTAQPELKAKCEMAIQYLKRALAIHQAAGNLGQQSVIVSKIADVYEKLGQTQQALESRRAALALAPAPDVSQRATILAQIAKAQSAAGESSQALETYNEILAVQVAKGDEQKQAYALKEIGDLQLTRLKQPQEALASYQRALLLYDRTKGGSDSGSFLPVVQNALHRAYLETKRQKSQ